MMNSPVKKRDSHHSNSHQNRSDFASTLKKWSAPIPPILLRKLGRVSDSPLGKVKVMLKVCDMAEEVSGTGILGVDTRKKQVTLIDPGGNSGPAGITITPEERRVDVSAPKMFAFDGIFGEEDDQAEICAAAGAELVASVVGGEDGCFVSLGYCTTGKKQTMFGRPANLKMGVVPTAISWLFKSIQEQKQKSGSRFSVRVSAVEVTGGSGHEIINDLLQPFAKDGDQPPGAYLLDSQGGVGGSSRGSKSSSVTAPILNTMSEVRAPNPETAGFYLDAALEAMSKEDPIRHFVFTLHVYQYTLDKNGKGAVVGGRSRLHCVMLGHGSPSISVLGGLLLAVLNGQRHLPSRDSKLGAILRECLGSLTCRAVVMIHISSAHSRYAETLAALQLGSRVHRLRRSRRLKMGSVGSGNGSGGSSGGSGEEMRMNSCLPSNGMSLNGGAVNGSGSLGCLGEGGEVTGSSDIDPSSSEQSCDTVIYLGPSIDDATDGEHPPVYLPSLENGSTDNTKCSLNGGGGSIPPPKTKSPKPKSNKVLDGSNFGGGNNSSKSEEKWIDGPKVAKYRQMSNGVGTGSIGRSSHGHHSHGHNSHGHELVMGVSGGVGGGGSGKKSETWIDGPAARVHHQGNNFPSPKKSVTQSNNHKTRSSSLATQPPGQGGGAVSQSVVDSPCSISSTKAEMIQKWISNQTHSNFLDDNNSSSHRSLGFGLGDADADALSCLFGVGLRSHFQSGSSALYANLPPPTSVGPAVSSTGQSQNQSQSQSKNSSPHHYPNQIHSQHLAQQTLLQQQYMHQHQQSLHQQQHHPHYSLYANTGHMRTQGGHGMEPEFKALTVFKTCDDYEDGEEEILTLSQGKQGMRGECIENGFEFELIEVVEPEVPVPTRDACLQVTEEDIALSFLEVEENPLPESDQNFCMGGSQSYFSCRASSHHHRVRSNSLSDGTGNVEGLTEVGNVNGSDQKTFLSLSEKNEDHPLRVLSQECLTVVSTFTDSLSINGGDMERFWPRLSFSGADDDMTLIDGHGQSPNGGHGHEMGICHGLCKNLVSLSQMSLTHGLCHSHNNNHNQTSQSPNCNNGNGGLVVAMEKKQPVSPCKNSSPSQNHSGLILSAEFTNSSPVPVPVSVPPPALSDESIFKLPRSPINPSPKIVTVPATTTATTTKKQGTLTKGHNRNDPQQSDAEQEAPIPPMKLLDLNPFLELELPGPNGSNVNSNNSNSNIHSSSLMPPRTAEQQHETSQQCISPKSPVPTTMSLMRPNASRGCDHDHHNFNGYNCSTISHNNGEQNGKNIILTSPQLPPPPSSLMSPVQIVNGNGNIHFHHSHSRGGSIVMETPSPPPASPLPELTKSPSKSKSRKIAKFFRSRSKSPKTAGAASTSSSDSGKSSVSVSGQSQSSVKADSLSLSPKVKLSSSSSSSSGASSTGVGVSASVINNILNNKSPSKIKKSVCSSTLLKLPPSNSHSAGTPNGNGSVHSIDYQFTCDSSLPIFLPSPTPQQLVQVQPPSSLTIASKLSD